ncbi:MAG: hypothetical protein ACREJ3_03905, partial [Polyangiaceae bacterium]
AYGDRWYRLWHLFLGWSWRIAAQGTGQGFQVVAHKNLNTFDRTVFIGRPAFGSQHVQEKEAAHPAAVAKNGKSRVADAE